MAWNTDDVTAATSAPAAALVRPAGYAFEAQGTQHAIYIGLSDNHVHELWWDDNGWHTDDLTAATGAPAPLAGPLAGYAFEAQGTQHVIYIGASDNDIHELWWDSNGWQTDDLTAATGAPAALAADLAGYVFEAQGTQHVIYRGASDNHVHELWWDSNGWHTDDLTAATAAPIVDGALVAYMFEAQGTQHVIYLCLSEGNICELWWDSNGWHTDNLTTVPSAHVTLAGYAFDAQGTQHVIYTNFLDGHIYELWWDSNGWHTNDLTAATGVSAPGCPPAGYAFEAQGTQHVMVISAEDNHVHELWRGA
jgi:fucose-binding lectin